MVESSSPHVPNRTTLQDQLTQQTIDGDLATKQARTDCDAYQTQELARRVREAQAQCDGLFVTVGGIPFDLTAPCLAVARAKQLTPGTPVTVEIKVGTGSPVAVDLRERGRGLSLGGTESAAASDRRNPAAVLVAGEVEWDLSPYLPSCLVRDVTIDVTLRVGTASQRLSLTRAMASQGFNCGQGFPYDMLNGVQGAAKYVDATYAVDGVLSPNAATPGAQLKGGTGMLSDGRVARRKFYEPSLLPQVDWKHWVAWKTAIITITFHLPATFEASSVLIFVSNENTNGIRAPTGFRINGEPQTSTTAVPTGTIGWLTFPVSLGPGGDCVIELINGSGSFVFVSEIKFE